MFRGPDEFPNNKLVLALHDLEQKHLMAMFARDIGLQVHATSINMRTVEKVGLEKGITRYRELGIRNLFFDQSFGAQDTDLVADIARLPIVRYLTVDATIGMAAMKRIVEVRDRIRTPNRPKLIATTVLPEQPDQDIERTFRQSIPALVGNLAEQAKDVGMDGFYSSPYEVGKGPDDFLRVVAGVRVRGMSIPNDLKQRTMTAEQLSVVHPKPDLIVIGEAVTGQPEYADSMAAFQRIIDGLVSGVTKVDTPG